MAFSFCPIHVFELRQRTSESRYIPNVPRAPALGFGRFLPRARAPPPFIAKEANTTTKNRKPVLQD